eukprot:g552.t1
MGRHLGRLLARLAARLMARLAGLARYPSAVVFFLLRALRAQLTNEYLVGMVLMAGVTPLATAAGRAASELKAAVMQLVFTNVRLGEQETKELMEYLRHHSSVTNGSMLTMCTHSDIESDVSGSRVYEYEPELNTAIRFYHRSPKTGRGHWIWVANYSYSESSTQPDPVVSTTVTVFGKDKSPVEEMIDLGREMLRTKRRKFLQVITTYNYTQDNYGLGWNHGYKTDKQQPGRSIKSVILPQMRTPAAGYLQSSGNSGTAEIDQAEALLADAREFLESERWYTERGIPYRRGYLLHGIPGGGKSSLVAAVASELKLPIYMLQLSNELLTDDTLHKLFQTMTLNPSILLLEDIDAASDLVKMREGTVEAMVLSEVASAVSSDSLSSHEDENLMEETDPPDGLISESHREGETRRDVMVSKWEGDTDSITPAAMHKEGYAAQIEDDFLLSENSTRHFSGNGQTGNGSGDVSNGEAGFNGKNSGGEQAQMMMLQLMKQQQEDQKKDREEKKKRERKITLSGLLNALDGPTATTGRILFMTTNFRNKLDPALIRSGRIDYEIEFRHADAWQAERLFKRFYLSFRDGDSPINSGSGDREGVDRNNCDPHLTTLALAQGFHSLQLTCKGI